MQRAETEGVTASFLWKLRYRPPSRVYVAEYEAVRSGFEAFCEARIEEAHLDLADARAGAIAGELDQQEER